MQSPRATPLTTRLNAPDASKTMDSMTAEEVTWSNGALVSVPSCPACRATGRELCLGDVADSLIPSATDVWSIWRCTSCNSLYLDPRPDEVSLPRAYDFDYMTHREETVSLPQGIIERFLWEMVNDYLNYRFGMTRTPANRLGRYVLSVALPWRLKLDYFGRHLGGRGRGILLDVGCGNGAFLLRAREMGWKVIGVDPDPAAILECRSHGLEVHEGTLDDLTDDLKGSVDVVTLSHTIEHVTNQQHVLARTAHFLVPGGRVWVATPNPGSLGLRHFGRHWRGLEPPRHLCIPSQHQLRKLLQGAGFENVHLKRRGAHSRFVISESLKIEAGATGRGRQVAAKLLRQVEDLLSTVSVRWAEESVVVARKPW
jgi:SAM-dependent methyltransferase